MLCIIWTSLIFNNFYAYRIRVHHVEFHLFPRQERSSIARESCIFCVLFFLSFFLSFPFRFSFSGLKPFSTQPSSNPTIQEYRLQRNGLDAILPACLDSYSLWWANDPKFLKMSTVTQHGLGSTGRQLREARPYSFVPNTTSTCKAIPF